MSPLLASYDFQAVNFFRPLDWRFRAAEHLVAAKRSRRKGPPVDPVVDRLVAVLKAEARPTKAGRATEAGPDRIAWREAARLRDGDALRRVEVEALLLARQSDAEIAARCGLSPGAVAWFEAALFHVRDHLAALDWVVARVIGRAFPTGDPGPVLKHFAYHGGPVALDVVLAVLLGRPLPPEITATFTRDPAYEEKRLRFLVELNVACLRATTDAELVALVDVYLEARCVDQGRVDAPPALRGDLRHHRAILALAAGRAGKANTGPKDPGRAPTGSAGSRPPTGEPRMTPIPSCSV